MRKVVWGYLIVYVVFYLIVTILELSKVNVDYVTALPYMHMFLIICLVLFIVGVNLPNDKLSVVNVKILRYAICTSMLLGIIELVRYRLIVSHYHGNKVVSSDFSYMAIVVVAISLIVYFISIVSEKYIENVQKHHLEKLAYHDLLTDMYNRTYCYELMDNMEKEEKNNYTMFFMDLNNLKIANDKFGHETGDALLKEAANCIMKVFSDDGFCGRWGGDEFIACVMGDEVTANKRLTQFTNLVKKIDDSKKFPFKFSIAVGKAVSSDYKPLRPEIAVRLADERMYISKEKMKTYGGNPV